MKIAEVFATVQGEGVLSGVPSLFIRTSGCNLRCAWCDTPYTSWTPEGEEWSAERLADWTAAFPSFRHAVLTGGEPMLFDEAAELTRRLKERGLHITIETAGTVYREVICDLMSISPKLQNSTPWERDGGQWAERHERMRIQIPVLERLTGEFEHQLKFVVAAARDLEEITELAGRLRTEPSRVLLMPEGVAPEVLRERAKWLIEECKSRGYRYCPRLHIEVYGNRRGV
jgi:7-carboxy-7-deazaguanine synthase